MQRMSLPSFFYVKTRKNVYEGMKNADTIALVYAEINVQIVNVIYKYGNRCLENTVLRCLSSVLASVSPC